MLPFLRRGATCVGVDLASQVGGCAIRSLYTAEGIDRTPFFLRAVAESLPFADQAFDIVICRLVLPYTRNEQALTEMARVLRADGRLVITVHRPGFYTRKFWRGIRTGQLLSSVHAARVLSAGLAYDVTGRQPSGGAPGFEVYQSRVRLLRQLDRLGLVAGPAVPAYDSHYAPMFVVRHKDPASRTGSDVDGPQEAAKAGGVPGEQQGVHDRRHPDPGKKERVRS
jgi:SAM-dependent methyltransferase